MPLRRVLFVLICVPFACVAADDTALEARIQRIENGLVAPVIVKGQPQKTMTLAERMQFFATPGVSIAFVNGGRIEWARAYGVREAGHPAKVTIDTIFNAGSISKPTTALAVARLANAGELDLDEDVNRRLASWKVPENEFTREKKVTLRGLLSHRAGVNVPSFIGYLAGQPVPTLEQVLDGKPPANTPAIRVEATPGEKFQYSGGGYTITQQLLIDTQRKPFPVLMKELVLDPLAMNHSTFEQPPFSGRNAAVGHDARGEVPKGKWRILPELAAAGMWTTPSDLARVVIDMQQNQNRSNWGLGFFVEGKGRSHRFSHGGSTLEFNAFLIGYTQGGQGAVIMCNALRCERLINEILRSIAREYGWPDFQPKEKAIGKIDPKVLNDYAGRYQFDFSKDYVLTLSPRENKLVVELNQPTGTSTSELYPESESRFFRTDVEVEVEFFRDATGRVTHMIFRQDGQDLRAARMIDAGRKPRD